MTLIRRTSQLLLDLRELKILPDECIVRANFVKEDVLLAIKFPNPTQAEKIDSIINAIKDEFKDVEVKDWWKFSKQNIKVIISKNEITSLKMTETYRYFDFED